MLYARLFSAISLNFFEKAWDDFFNKPITQPFGNFETRISLTTSKYKNCHVIGCIFQNCSNTLNGGAIYYQYNGGKFLVEFSTFHSCHAYNGGAIYTFTSCDFISNCICSYKCNADWTGQYVYADLGETNENRITQSSVCSSGNGISSFAPIYFWYGSQICKLTNISNNKLELYYSAIEYGYGSPFGLEITLCSINSNSAENTCIWLDSETTAKSYLVDKCNIINNRQEVLYRAIICVGKDTTIQNSCILGNTGPEGFSLFYNYGNAFFFRTLTLINCTLPSSYDITGNTVNTENALPEKSFIHGFRLTEGSLCIAGTDSVK